MKKIAAFALATLFSLTVFVPAQAGEKDNVDPIVTSSIKKPVKSDGSKYPVNALSGFNF